MPNAKKGDRLRRMKRISWPPTSSAIGLLFAIAAPVLLGACANEPFRTQAPKALSEAVFPADGSPPDPVLVPQGFQARIISLCYSRMINELSEVESLAAKSCEAEGERLEYRGDDRFLNTCPVFQPLRANYLCFQPLTAPG